VEDVKEVVHILCNDGRTCARCRTVIVPESERPYPPAVHVVALTNRYGIITSWRTGDRPLCPRPRSGGRA
jgi:hypothetical protein